MVTSNEVRIGSWLKWKDNEQEFDCAAGLFIRPEFWNHLRLGDIEPIPLTPEILITCGFYQLPHFTIQNNFIKDCGRGRFLSVASVATPNEMIFLTEEDAPEVKNIIVARNYDYDGKTYLHQLQNLYFSLTGEELTYNPLTQTIQSGSNTVTNTEEK